MKKSNSINRFILLGYLYIGVVLLYSSCSPQRPSLNAYRLKKIDFISNEKNRDALIEFARENIGIKYKRAGKGKEGFDCSGLVSYVYQHFYLSPGPSAQQQAKDKTEIAILDALPGDLIFFGTKKSITHVGIISQNKSDKLYVIHSTSSKGVIEENILLSDYWLKRIIKIVNLNSYINPDDISGL